MIRIVCLMAFLLLAGNVYASTPELRASVNVSRIDAYVNEEILVTVRVEAPASAFNVTDPYLELKQVDLYSLHKREFKQTIGGKKFSVSEIVYAVFVQQPGELVIPSLRFKATLPITDDAQTSNPILNVETETQRLTITSAPASDAAWFPAKSVTISGSWPADKNTLYRAGEPITRIISIHLEGQHPAAIPNVEPTEIEGVKSYPDLPQLTLKKSASGLGGTQTKSVTLIMDRAKTVTLPEMNIDWWDINEGSWKRATLPAETLTVQPAIMSLTWVKERNRYRWALLLLAAVAGSLALLSALLWRKQHVLAKHIEKTGARGTAALTEKAAWLNLQRSLKQQKPTQVRHDLLAWVRVRWPEYRMTRLDQLTHIDSQLAAHAQELNEGLYSKHSSGQANYAALTNSLRKLRKLKARNAGQSAVGSRRALYPEENKN